ncbi:TIGR03790 family protein [Rhodoferax bucti]|uniref:TIGR03790 family protein n=1 Tax=Rhodoferax bucti TaxID=2576305 RepID=UPI001107F4A2|nr:TIGR03790 family protein [Rhodoferax bucti]
MPRWHSALRWLLAGWAVWAAATAGAQQTVLPAKPVWVNVPRIQGHLSAADVGVVINTSDPYSVAVGEYYVLQRGIPAEQVLRTSLPVKAALTAAELELLSQQVQAFMGPSVQALALAWRQPYAVECNSLTAALTLGFAPEVCSQTCAPTRPSVLFNHASARPFTDLGVRPSMLLAGKTVASAMALIDRGVAADRQLGKRGVPPASMVLLRTTDAARNVRSAWYPPIPAMGQPDPLQPLGAQLRVQDSSTELPPRVLLYQTGAVRVEHPTAIDWLPGALADHLTSFGGQLNNTGGQMTALEWLEAGATASYGTVSEPCNHWQKFPHPQVLLLHYLQGATALEAYWRSVAWPAQGVLVGEPLAAPFGR